MMLTFVGAHGLEMDLVTPVTNPINGDIFYTEAVKKFHEITGIETTPDFMEKGPKGPWQFFFSKEADIDAFIDKFPNCVMTLEGHPKIALKCVKRDIEEYLPKTSANEGYFPSSSTGGPARTIESQLIHFVIRLYSPWEARNLKMRHFVEGLLLFGFEVLKCNRE